MTRTFSFRISSALKSLIGRDLITNPFVAIFELVKNGFDADASRVSVHFGDDSVTIVDDGYGMSAADLEHKWLFVAYSEKKKRGDEARPGSERFTAGSKGVGRFAADQLAATLQLQTRAKDSKKVEFLEIDWDEFERDQENEFVNVAVRRSTRSEFDLPDGCDSPSCGTALVMKRLRQPWDRESLLRLRRYLSRLLDPFEETGASFAIHLHAPRELEADQTEIAKTSGGSTEDEPPIVVNGKIETNLQQVLAAGTTAVHVALSADGTRLTTTLTDRGELVYRMAEPNRWPELRSSRFDCRLYYLNRAAKHRFTRRMGVKAVDFGSVFLFRNGFRVFPVGEVGDDFFTIDSRKQQGVRRYLGSRDVIGRVNVRGDNQTFVESTSRDQGLIRNPAVAALQQCFKETCLKRLESYVVGLAWKDRDDQVEATPIRMKSPEARERLVSVLVGLTRGEGAELLEVAPNLDDLLSSTLTRGKETLAALDEIAEHRRDPKLKAAVRDAEARLRALARERAQAERERDAALEAAEKAEAERRLAEERESRGLAELAIEKRRALFLEHSAPIDVQLMQELMHQVGIQASDATVGIRNALRLLRRQPLDMESVERTLSKIAWRVEQVHAVTRMTTRANFPMVARESISDVSQFIAEYLSRVSAGYHEVKISVSGTVTPFVRSFRPIDLSIALDNLVANAGRAGATAIDFALSVKLHPDPQELRVRVTDDGSGLNAGIVEPSRIFERGFTTTEGSGLGLWHTRSALSEMNALIDIELLSHRKVAFNIRIPR